MSIVVREALPADAETLHRFITELAVYEREPDPDVPLVCLDEFCKQLLSEVAPPLAAKPAAGGAPPARLQVAKVFGRAAGEVKAAFAKLTSPAACARVTPKQRRVIVLKFGPDGRLTGTKYAGGGAPNAATKTCVAAMTKGLKLPPAKKATAVTAILHAGK